MWAEDVADLIRPLYDRMVLRVLQSHVIHTDDTVMPMPAPPPEGQTRQARMGVYIGDQDHPYNVFDFTLSRAGDGPAKFLHPFRGSPQADTYGGYDVICVEKSITQSGCWAHARRKLVDTQSLNHEITTEALRRAHSVPVLDALHIRLQSWRERLLPKHPVAQATLPRSQSLFQMCGSDRRRIPLSSAMLPSLMTIAELD